MSDLIAELSSRFTRREVRSAAANAPLSDGNAGVLLAAIKQIPHAHGWALHLIS